MPRADAAMSSGFPAIAKTWAKGALFPSAYKSAAGVWRSACRLRQLGADMPFWISTCIRHGRPGILLHFGVAPGDDLLCTAVVHELGKRGKRRIWMMSNHPDMFQGNPEVERVVPVEEKHRRFAHAWRADSETLEYSQLDKAADRGVSPARHIIAEMCAQVGIEGAVEIRPRLTLTAEERQKAAGLKGRIAIQSSGLAARFPMRNKEWIPERFQEVVTALRGEFEFVQLGSESDPKLDGSMDLRGRTSKRETAAILAESLFFIGNVGLLMHLARAVECPAVILFGGREAPWQSGYSCNINLFSPEPCAPCWRMNQCDYGRVCMTKITSENVIQAAREIASRDRKALQVDTVEVVAA